MVEIVRLRIRLIMWEMRSVMVMLRDVLVCGPQVVVPFCLRSLRWMLIIDGLIVLAGFASLVGV